MDDEDMIDDEVEMKIDDEVEMKDTHVDKIDDIDLQESTIPGFDSPIDTIKLTEKEKQKQSLEKTMDMCEDKIGIEIGPNEKNWANEWQKGFFSLS